MRGKIFVILFSMIILCSSICSARISDNRFFFGGLTVGSKMSDAIKIYGFPNKTKTAYDQMHNTYDHYWGNGSLWVSEGNRDDIHSIFVNADNGIATIDGVKIGMNIEVIFKVYGKEDYMFTDDRKMKYFIYYKGIDTNIALQFAEQNGKIFAIYLHSTV